MVNHHGTPLFPLPNPTNTNYANPSNWTYNNEVDMETDDYEPSPKGGNVRGDKGGVGSSGATHAKAIFDPPMTSSCNVAGSSWCNKDYFY